MVSKQRCPSVLDRGGKDRQEGHQVAGPTEEVNPVMVYLYFRVCVHALYSSISATPLCICLNAIRMQEYKHLFSKHHRDGLWKELNLYSRILDPLLTAQVVTRAYASGSPALFSNASTQKPDGTLQRN
jgi:hypothetical protein